MNKDYILINTKTGKEVKVGDKVTDFRGEKGILTETTPTSGANGHIYMDGNRFYPSVIGCKFVPKPLYVVVRSMEESENFATVEVLQRRLFTKEEDANEWCGQLTADFGKGYEVVPLTPE